MKPRGASTVRRSKAPDSYETEFLRVSPMKSSKLLAIALLTTFGAACSNIERSRSLDNPAIAGTTLASQVCSNCHGLDGNSTSPNFPQLAGQQKEYLIAQLTGFRNHKRLDPAGFEYMWGISRSLTDEQIGDLATYYAAKIRNAPGPSSNPSLIAEGKDIFVNGISEKSVPACASCHGEQGQGMAGNPRLANQHEDYLVKQLMVFQRTDERPEGSVMKVVAHSMTPLDMKAVAAYLQEMPSE